MKPAPAAKRATGGKHELRRWAVGKHQDTTGSYVRTFVNPAQKKPVTLRSALGASVGNVAAAATANTKGNIARAAHVFLDFQ